MISKTWYSDAVTLKALLFGKPYTIASGILGLVFPYTILEVLFIKFGVLERRINQERDEF